jgi:hypothetical protein
MLKVLACVLLASALAACSFSSVATPTPFGRVLFGLMVQEPDVFPPGWTCTPRGIVKNGTPTADAPCACHRMNHSDSCDEPEKDVEDPGCTQYCHKEHCGCPVTCAAPK